MYRLFHRGKFFSVLVYIGKGLKKMQLYRIKDGLSIISTVYPIEWFFSLRLAAIFEEYWYWKASLVLRLTAPLDCPCIGLNIKLSQVPSDHQYNIHSIGRYLQLHRREYSLVWFVGEIEHYSLLLLWESDRVVANAYFKSWLCTKYHHVLHSPCPNFLLSWG